MSQLNLKEKLNKFTTGKTLGLLLAIVAGVIGGYIYYLEVGCVSGSCAITSNPYLSTLWGGLLGWVLGDTILGKKNEKKDARSGKGE